MVHSNDYGSSLAYVIQMVVCVVGIYGCFGLWSLKQERLLTKPYVHAHLDFSVGGAEEERFPGVWSVSLAQSASSALLGAVAFSAFSAYSRFISSEVYRGSRQGHAHKQSKAKSAKGGDGGWGASLGPLAVVGFTNAFGTSLGLLATRFLPFPVVLAGKMGKMIPVMSVGYFWFGLRYGKERVMLCMLLSLGVYLFYALDPSPKKGSRGSSSMANTEYGPGVGFLLLLLNLIMDGVTNAAQDVMVKKARWESLSLMTAVNAATSLWLIVAMLMAECVSWLPKEQVNALDGFPLLSLFVPWQDGSNSLAFFERHPDALWDLALLCLVNAFGQLFIFRTITLFGTLTLTGLTLLRKAGSVGLSILIHGHPVSLSQWLALGLTVACVVCDAKISVSKASSKTAPVQSSPLKRSRSSSSAKSKSGRDQLEGVVGKAKSTRAKGRKPRDTSSTSIDSSKRKRSVRQKIDKNKGRTKRAS